ncbi:hypothetical protein MKW94_025142 [Papaver nudicaule]|uniref:Uncharacterized protein n=1 Tax=Papaver nudicaule TaxID=74823 RepID=A0AA41W2T4_PAPNU|nr:hypothetical protein [Papaver nudicaule]
MKFGKELKSQMVPEWQEAYVNYDSLKSVLKDIHQRKSSSSSAIPSMNRQMSRYRAFSGLLHRNPSAAASSSTAVLGAGELHHRHHSYHESEEDDEEQVQVILVKNPTNLREGTREEGQYQTKFLMTAEAGGEYELVFFRRLDDEFNKVNKFYKDKVDEVMEEADSLNKQMDALIAFRVKVDNPQGLLAVDGDSWTVEMDRFSSDVAASAPMAVTTPNGGTAARKHSKSSPSMRILHKSAAIEQIDEGSREGSLSDKYASSGSGRASDSTDPSTSTTNAVENNVAKKKPTRPPPLQILNRVQINNTPETPISTIKGIMNNVNSNGNSVSRLSADDSSFKKENLKKIEGQLRRAFIEFYQKLRLLKSYNFLNLLAFSKIMKKYDKVASRSASKSYLNMVDRSYLGSYDGVTRLMDRVEATFIKHFANSNRSKGIRILRPKAKKEKHAISFFLVNYPFIFGFKQGTELGYREVFLLSSAVATLALASVLANLDMEMDVKTKDYKALTEILPLGLVILVLLIAICPFNIIYRSSRYFLLMCLFHCLLAPLYKVTLPDFFLADQLTSQVQAIRSLEFYVCYYGWGDFKRRNNTCKDNEIYNVFYFILALAPYWSRFCQVFISSNTSKKFFFVVSVRKISVLIISQCALLQCLRRLYDEQDAMQGYNAFKYFSTMVAVLMRTAYTRSPLTRWLVLAWISSVVATTLSTYWDIVIDWGLLQRNSRNRWLREKLLVSRKNVYFGAMALNVLLRFAWLQTMLNFHVSFLHKEALTTIVASLEIIRRGVWNFFRLENEHLNNVGKFRAFKTVPLPFSYDEDDEDKDD